MRPSDHQGEKKRKIFNNSIIDLYEKGHVAKVHIHSEMSVSLKQIVEEALHVLNRSKV